MWRIISIKSVESKLYKGSPKQLLHYFVNIREGLNIYWVIILPRLRHPRVFVHFHSFSCVATLPSSITSGTQPPNTYILLPITVEECRLLGSGADPFRVGFVQFIVSTTRKKKAITLCYSSTHSLQALGCSLTYHTHTSFHFGSPD